MPSIKIRALQEVKIKLFETISNKSFRIAGMIILGTARGSRDQDICKTSLKHVAFLFVPKVWKLCKELWEAEKVAGNASFPITIKEALDYMNYEYP
tara:strand:+ start:560 stop:847 length:288 start_codon:yes stop_codon:yes gene_type:complete